MVYLTFRIKIKREVDSRQMSIPSLLIGHLLIIKLQLNTLIKHSALEDKHMTRPKPPTQA